MTTWQMTHDDGRTYAWEGNVLEASNIPVVVQNAWACLCAGCEDARGWTLTNLETGEESTWLTVRRDLERTVWERDL